MKELVKVKLIAEFKEEVKLIAIERDEHQIYANRRNIKLVDKEPRQKKRQEVSKSGKIAVYKLYSCLQVLDSHDEVLKNDTKL